MEEHLASSGGISARKATVSSLVHENGRLKGQTSWSRGQERAGADGRPSIGDAKLQGNSPESLSRATQNTRKVVVSFMVE